MDGPNPAQKALQSATHQWLDFKAKCLATRLEPEKFEEFVPLIHSRYPLPPVAVADIFLRPPPSRTYSVDPRIPIYIQILSRLGYIDAPSLLNAVYNYSSSHAQLQSDHASGADGADTAKPKQPVRYTNAFWAEEVFFYHVIKTIVEGTAFRDSLAPVHMAKVVAKWMTLFAQASTAFAAVMLGDMQHSDARNQMEISKGAFVPLLLRLVDSPDFVRAISKPDAKDARRELHASLSSFIPSLQPAPQFVEKLEVFRTETLAQLDPPDKKSQAAEAAMDELLESAVGSDNLVIPEIPITNTRAGLYIYLNASLVARPILDDRMLFSYLNNRLGGDAQASAIDLILASFDALANAVFRTERLKDAHLFRSYLINKVPLLLCQLCPPGFANTSAELCITMALNQVDTGTFPTASLMFDESRQNNPYTESVREEFCAACALHGLIQREHVERILGEISMSYEPSLEKYSKDKLVQDCLSDPSKMQALVRELDKMDGNVGAVCQALVELMRHLCHNRETMSLKLLCGQLVQKPLSLDVLLLFERLPTVLEPLCQLLDNWHYDEDQGEYQPVYEEFGAIMLLVLAFAYRYKLSGADMGIQSPDSRVAQIISRAHVSRQIQDLTEQESQHLGGWVHGLFDSEAGGLGDDLMSSCPPQDFYLLIATLFQNIVVAYGDGYLTDESLKSGIEYLVDTFLLPSLVPAITFLSEYLWIDQKEQKSIIKILQLILLPTSISGEASTMLSSVKNLVAKPLENALRTYQRRDPKNQDIEPLLQALKESLPLSRRTGSAEFNELETWSSNSNNPNSPGFVGTIRHQIQTLVQWSLHPEVNYTPPTYTHRQMIAARQLMGPRRALRAILEETRAQTEAGNASIVYDIATALICAPDVTNDAPAPTGLLDTSGSMQGRRLSLRDVLKLLAEEYKKVQKQDGTLAEIIVRLHRRVEAQMVMPAPPAIMQNTDLLGGNAGTMGEGLASGPGAQADGMAVDNVMGMDGLGTDLGLGGPSGSGAGLDSGGDNDLFDLDASMDVFDGWDSNMDLT
ncbi:hypothetical protein S40293_04631 [Stachybotrys chartarum IBT 40293]|nr:hypothetical protein S40293_04631 [Stachybotrys chartarum IBT 40293]